MMIYEATDGSVWRIQTNGNGAATSARQMGCGRLVTSNRGGACGRVDVIREIEAQSDEPAPAPPPVWERETWTADGTKILHEEDPAIIGNFDDSDPMFAKARATLAAAAPKMKRAGDALEALLVDDYWQSDRLAAARDAWRAASIKAEGGGE